MYKWPDLLGLYDAQIQQIKQQLTIPEGTVVDEVVWYDKDADSVMCQIILDPRGEARVLHESKLKPYNE